MSLFDVGPVSRWAGSREIVLSSSIVCNWCGPTFVVEYTQPALFRHGGYGAAVGHHRRFCHCGAVDIGTVTTLNPRVFA